MEVNTIHVIGRCAWPNTEIARACGVDEGSVRNYRKELSSELPKIPSPIRHVTRGGKTYEMDTGLWGSGHDG
jgi:hypothetical protein